MGFEDDLLRDTPRGIFGKEDAVPAARWADPDEPGPDWAYTRSKVLLGYRRGRAIGSGDDRHLLMVAGSRAGKGVSFVIPNLLLYEGSVLAIDPKGELASLTAQRRAAKPPNGAAHKVVVLDPFDVSGEHTKPFRGSFNPLSEIDPDSETAIDDAALLAEALVVDEGSSEKHWINGARELVKGMILYALSQDEEWRNLSTVRDLFHQDPREKADGTLGGGFRDGLKAMAGCTAFHGLVAAIGNSFLTKEDRELSALISTADVQLGFLDSAPLARCMARSSFSLSQLKTTKTTVYLCLPAARMGTHAKWLRAIFNLALLMCERVRVKPDPPLIFLLDEFATLGHMRSLEMAAGQIAGFGVRLFTIVQDLTQLQRLYDKTWETFIGNAGATIFFGNADATTLEYVSKKLGTIGFDLKRLSGAGPSARTGGAKLIEEQLQTTHLLEPYEVEMLFARERQRALILYPGLRPLVVRRAHYAKDPAFKELP